MVSSKKLMKMAQKWRNLAILSRRRITFSRTTSGVQAEHHSTPDPVKGHVILYSSDGKRFAIPLPYLDCELFREPLTMAEEEYGLPSHGSIILPCDAVFMEYAISLLRRKATKGMEKALLTTIRTSLWSTSSCINHEQSNLQSLVCSY